MSKGMEKYALSLSSAIFTNALQRASTKEKHAKELQALNEKYVDAQADIQMLPEPYRSNVLSSLAVCHLESESSNGPVTGVTKLQERRDLAAWASAKLQQDTTPAVNDQ